jgi:predicted ribosomally synthesized peptide with nif11-like leader
MFRCIDVDNTRKEEAMKTIQGFIQRLHNDPEFEHKAQAFDNNEDFLAFINSEGYDFTLDQLLEAFNLEKESQGHQVDTGEAPQKTLKDFIQRLQNDPEFEKKAQVFENNEEFMAFVRSEGYDFNLDELLKEFNDDKGSRETTVDISAVPKKTLEEFTQRLQNDPEFEKKAQAFNNSADFMIFVKGEGYDFNLDELLGELNRVESLPKPPDETSPAAIIPEEPLMGMQDYLDNQNETNRPCTIDNCMTPANNSEKGLKPDQPSENLQKSQKEISLRRLEGIGTGGRRRGIRWKNVEN